MLLFFTAVIPVVLFFIITSPVLLVLEVVRLFDPVAASKAAQPFVRIGFRIVMFCAGSKTYRLGLENIPRDRAVMFASNHKSLLDAAVGYGAIPIQVGFVAKNVLRKVPFLSWWMDLCSCFFLDRQNPRSGMDMILYSIDNIKKGVSMFIAPEGTRSRTGEMLPFKQGSFKIATKSGCPIVPVAISGTDDVLENNRPLHVKRAVTVIEFGKPIYLEDLTEDELKSIGEYTREKVLEMLKGHEKYIYNNPTPKALRKAAEKAQSDLPKTESEE